MSMAHISTIEYEMSLVRAASEYHTDVQELCRTGTSPHGLWGPRELSPPLMGNNTKESKKLDLEPQPGSTMELALVARCG